MGRKPVADPVAVISWQRQQNGGAGTSDSKTALHFDISIATVKRYRAGYAESLRMRVADAFKEWSNNNPEGLNIAAMERRHGLPVDSLRRFIYGAPRSPV
ncbi:hypothetical protein P3G55_18980 [Leptospira sp. 96542]|nr:hypothetical protein [Leptospira sp. 96542]